MNDLTKYLDTSNQYVTIDTNLYQDPEINQLSRALPYLHIFATAITEEETGQEVIMGYELQETHFDEGQWDLPKFAPNRSKPKMFTVGASMIGGHDVIAPDGYGSDFLQKILDIATSGSVQYYRDFNSSLKGIRNHIKDANILQIHCAFSHTILISNDFKFFGQDNSEQRRELENLASTRIMSANQFKLIYMPHISN